MESHIKQHPDSSLWVATRGRGDTIFILANINEDIHKESIQAIFWWMGMAEAMITQHGDNGPNTHNCSSTPIDRIFLPTPLIPAIHSGYLAFGEGIPSDHRAMWIDIPVVALGWFQVPELVPLKAWCLKCEDPRIVQWYNDALHKTLQDQNIFQQLAKLAKNVHNWWLMWQQQREYEAIDMATAKAKLYAELVCRKLPVGKVQWCPRLTQAITCILYWKGIKNAAKEAKQIGTQYLQWLAKRRVSTCYRARRYGERQDFKQNKTRVQNLYETEKWYGQAQSMDWPANQGTSQKPELIQKN